MVELNLMVWRAALKEEQQNSCGLSSSERRRELVCVTSGNSYLGSHIVKELLAHGYPVRVTVQYQVDFDDMRELMRDEEINQLESVVVANMGDVDSLSDAFRGCHAIFHTSSYIDPHGISGYSEGMAFVEAEGAKNVIEACGRAAYIKRCIFTSSLLASIWKGDNVDRVVDETCWSDEEFCRENRVHNILSLKSGAALLLGELGNCLRAFVVSSLEWRIRQNQPNTLKIVSVTSSSEVQYFCGAADWLVWFAEPRRARLFFFFTCLLEFAAFSQAVAEISRSVLSSKLPNLQVFGLYKPTHSLWRNYFCGFCPAKHFYLSVLWKKKAPHFALSTIRGQRATQRKGHPS